MSSFRKDPDSTLDYQWDWSSWVPTGDSVSTAEIASGAAETPAADELEITTGPTVDGDTVTVWLAGGTAGTTYEVTCRVTTTQGRIDDRTATIRVAER